MSYSQTIEGKEQSKRMIDCRLALEYKTAKEFYEAFSDDGRLFSYAKYQKYESGERLLSRASAILFAKFFNVDWEWLQNGEEVKQSPNIHKIGYVQAGVFTEQNQLPTTEWKQVHCSVPKVFQDKNVFALGVKGDSMNKVFPADRTKLICVAIEDYVKYKEVKNGDFIIAERQTPDGMYETTVKRYNKLPDGTIVLEAMSTDLQYNNIIIGQDNAEYRIIAVVIKYKVTLKGF